MKFPLKCQIYHISSTRKDNFEYFYAVLTLYFEAPEQPFIQQPVVKLWIVIKIATVFNPVLSLIAIVAVVNQAAREQKEYNLEIEVKLKLAKARLGRQVRELVKKERQRQQWVQLKYHSQLNLTHHPSLQ